MWNIIILSGLFVFAVCGCDNHQTLTKNVKKDDYLEKAKKAYYGKKYKESLILFVDCQNEVTQNKHSEAVLGEIISLCSLNDMATIESKIQKWQIDNVYYWDGRTFDPFANTSLNYSEFLKKNNSTYKNLHIVDLLIQQGNDIAIKNFQKLFVKDLHIEKFIVAKAWHALLNGFYKEASNLFSLLEDPLDEVLRDKLTGLLLIEVLSGVDEIKTLDPLIIKEDTYFMNATLVDFSKNVKSLPLSSQNTISKEVWISDMLFHLGLIAKHPLTVWERGKLFVAKNTNKFNSPILAKDYLELFSIAIGWQVFKKGNLDEAKSTFQKIANGTSAPRVYEANLGLSIIHWKEEEDIDEILAYQKKLPQTHSYWLGGKEIDLFTSKKRSKESWEKSLTSNQKFYLVILDALCRLGEGRSAYLLYGELVNNTDDKVLISLYEKEEKNIPKDVYAENKIWEKID